MACLQDLEDTTGSWELYGQEDKKRYPSLQDDFFKRAAGPLTRRESIFAFTFAGAQCFLSQALPNLLFLCQAMRVVHATEDSSQARDVAACCQALPDPEKLDDCLVDVVR